MEQSINDQHDENEPSEVIGEYAEQREFSGLG